MRPCPEFYGNNARRKRYPAPLGHRCPHASFADRRTEEFEQGLRSWLETSEGKFAQYLARRQRAS